jgi:hypothetical protein
MLPILQSTRPRRLQLPPLRCEETRRLKSKAAFLLQTLAILAALAALRLFLITP